MVSTWWRRLQSIGACAEAVEWCRGRPSLAAAWRECARGDWMLWLVGRCNASAPWSEERKPLVLLACAIARTALKYVRAGELRPLRPLRAVEMAEAWCRGEATRADVVKARAATATATAYATADAYAARSKARAEQADIIRAHYPAPPSLSAVPRAVAA